jgi:hypothetical protein
LLPDRDVALPARFPARFSFGAGASEGAISLKNASSIPERETKKL